MELKDNNQKVEVIVSRQGDSSGEVSLVNVFYNMAAKKKIYLRVLAILLILGLILPMFLAEISSKDPDAQAVIKLTYDKPDTISFSSYVLQEAISKTKMSEDISLSELESNLKIEQLLSEETRQRLEVLEAQVAASGTQVGQAANISLRYINTYIITLANGFGNPDARSKTYLSGTEMRDLLNNIIESYNNYLYKNKTDFTVPGTTISDMDKDNLDYLESLDIIREELNSFKAYCDANKLLYPEYRSAATGFSFEDLSTAIATVIDIDVNYLYSYILSTGVSKDPDSLLNRYNYDLRTARLSLAETENNIASNKKIIEEFQNQTVAYAASEGQSGQTTSITTEYYNSLVLGQLELYESKSQLEQSISDLEYKIATLASATSTADVEKVRADFERIYEDAGKIQQIVFAQAEELIESDAVKNAFMTTTAAQTKVTSFFSSRNIKKAIIGGVAGAFIAVVVWFIDGFIQEAKKEGRKDGEAA